MSVAVIQQRRVVCAVCANGGHLVAREHPSGPRLHTRQKVPKFKIDTPSPRAILNARPASPHTPLSACLSASLSVCACPSVPCDGTGTNAQVLNAMVANLRLASNSISNSDATDPRAAMGNRRTQAHGAFRGDHASECSCDAGSGPLLRSCPESPTHSRSPTRKTHTSPVHACAVPFRRHRTRPHTCPPASSPLPFLRNLGKSPPLSGLFPARCQLLSAHCTQRRLTHIQTYTLCRRTVSTAFCPPRSASFLLKP